MGPLAVARQARPSSTSRMCSTATDCHRAVGRRRLAGSGGGGGDAQSCACSERVAALDAELHGAARGYVAPERMTEMLRALLAGQHGLKLVSLRNLPVESLSQARRGSRAARRRREAARAGPPIAARSCIPSRSWSRATMPAWSRTCARSRRCRGAFTGNARADAGEYPSQSGAHRHRRAQPVARLDRAYEAPSSLPLVARWRAARRGGARARRAARSDAPAAGAGAPRRAPRRRARADRRVDLRRATQRHIQRPARHGRRSVVGAYTIDDDARGRRALSPCTGPCTNCTCRTRRCTVKKPATASARGRRAEANDHAARDSCRCAVPCWHWHWRWPRRRPPATSRASTSTSSTRRRARSSRDSSTAPPTTSCSSRASAAR